MSKAGSLHQLRGNQSENNTGEESTGCKEGPEGRGREERGEKEGEWEEREGGTHGVAFVFMIFWWGTNEGME